MRFPIIDGHNDSLCHLAPFTRESVQDFLVRHTERHLDLPRAREGWLSGGFFAVFVEAERVGAEAGSAADSEPEAPPGSAAEPDPDPEPGFVAEPGFGADSEPEASPGSVAEPAPDPEPDFEAKPDWAPESGRSGATRATEAKERGRPALAKPVDQAHAFRATMAMVAGLFRLEAASEGQIKVVRTVDELDACMERGVLAAILHFEGAEAIDADLNALEVFYRAGLRSLGIVWSRPNIFGQGVPFLRCHSPDTGPGLTDAGKALVHACNRLGIMIDVSHLNEKGFWDVVRITEAPIVATHSCAHALCPVPRNLTDRQLDAIRESDGMVGVNFSMNFLCEEGDKDRNTLNPLVRHIDYLVDRLGIDRVGFGSDFDGATIPADIGDVTGFPRLVAALRQRGYDEESLQKLTYGNWRRVLLRTWAGRPTPSSCSACGTGVVKCP